MGRGGLDGRGEAGGDQVLGMHLSVTANPVASRGDLGKIPPLPKEGAWRPRLPAIPSSPQAFRITGPELSCSVLCSFFLSTSA